jgi:hypothetical protein
MGAFIKLDITYWPLISPLPIEQEIICHSLKL